MPQIKKCVTGYRFKNVWQDTKKCDRNYLLSKFAYVHNIQSGGQTGSEHAADSKLRYTIQFSILMLCAKYQKAGLCGSREKCDRIFLWRRRRRKTTDSDSYMSPPLKRAGDTITPPHYFVCGGYYDFTVCYNWPWATWKIFKFLYRWKLPIKVPCPGTRYTDWLAHLTCGRAPVHGTHIDLLTWHAAVPRFMAQRFEGFTSPSQ